MLQVLAADEFWPAQGGKAPELSQVKDALDAILSSQQRLELGFLLPLCACADHTTVIIFEYTSHPRLVSTSNSPTRSRNPRFASHNLDRQGSRCRWWDVLPTRLRGCWSNVSDQQGEEGVADREGAVGKVLYEKPVRANAIEATPGRIWRALDDGLWMFGKDLVVMWWTILEEEYFIVERKG
nr:unnamed protein product [Digitaria exilis]